MLLLCNQGKFKNSHLGLKDPESCGQHWTSIFTAPPFPCIIYSKPHSHYLMLFKLISSFLSTYSYLELWSLRLSSGTKLMAHWIWGWINLNHILHLYTLRPLGTFLLQYLTYQIQIEPLWCDCFVFVITCIYLYSFIKLINLTYNVV